MASKDLVNSYLCFSLLCAFLNIPPTILHVSQGHSGPASFGIWAVSLNLLAFINGAVWRNDALDRAPFFCDISSKVGVVGPLGLLISNCCIIRYLALILTPNQFMEESRQKRRRILFDYALSFGLPAVIAGASVVYQVARYQVNNLAGCSSASALVWPTFILSIVWPLIFCGVSCGYSFYVLYRLVQRHRDLSKLVNCAGTPLNLSRFARMGALSVTYFCVAAPCAIYGTLETIAATGPYVPWVSWSTVHNEDNKLTMVRQYPLYEYQLRDWLPIAAGLMMILFFSFSSESLTMYSKLGTICLIQCLSIKDKFTPRAFLWGSWRQHRSESKNPFTTPSSPWSSRQDELPTTSQISNSGSLQGLQSEKMGMASFKIQVAVVENTLQC